MNSFIFLSVEEIVTEISMSNDNKPWLILEGISDGMFFSGRQTIGNPKPVVAYGWENVVGVIAKVLEEKIASKVVGFIDRDYRKELGIEMPYEEIIVITDFRDLEISMFESEALDRIIVEFASDLKIPKSAQKKADIENVRRHIYSIASSIGKLRYYCLKNNIGCGFKELVFSKFIDPNNLSLDVNKLVSQLNSKSEIKISKEQVIEALNEDLPENLNDPRYLCSGHDVIEIFGMSLRKMWGTNNSGDVKSSKLESCFRIGYPNDVFFKTPMFEKLKRLLE